MSKISLFECDSETDLVLFLRGSSNTLAIMVELE